MEWVKRDIEFGFEDSMRCRRGRFDSIYQPLRHGFADPPWIAKQLAFTVNDKKDKIDDLIRKIKNGFCEIENGFHKDGFHKGKIKKKHIKHVEECTKDVEACAKELGRMVKTDSRLCDLLGRDSLELIVSLLRHEQNEKLQALAAIILKPVVSYSCNKNEVGVVIENITPLVLHLICSPVDSVRAEALWLLRNLVFKLPKSSIEQALSPVISIILDDSISDKVLHPASEILIVVCQEHPKLSREKLKLVVQALMKLIESNFFDQLVDGCLGLALLCDGRKEMIVEEKDFKPLISRLVQFMNWEERGAIIHGLLCLGSIVRWGNDDAIEAIIQDKGDEGSMHILSILLEEGDMYIVKHVCWIISNITARKIKHIVEVLLGNPRLIKLVVNVAQTCTLPDVVKEALWAISNAMCCVGYHDYSSTSSYLIIPWFWDNCKDKSWVRRLTPFLSDKLLVMVFIEGMSKIAAAHLSLFEDLLLCAGSQSRYHSALLTIFKGLWSGTESEDFPVVLEWTFVQSWEPQLHLFYDGLRKEWLFKKGYIR